MASFNLDNYETVAARLDRWLSEYSGDHVVPRTKVVTDLVHYTDTRCVFRAELYIDDKLVATGWAEETRGEGMVNRTSHLENCESSAVGRALANLGLAGSDPAKRPSREEMEKVQRHTTSYPKPAPRPQQSFDSEPTPDEMAEVMGNLADSFGAKEVTKPAPTIKNPGEAASTKQIGMIRALLSQQGVRSKDEQAGYAKATLGRDVDSLESITKGEASTLITSLK
jgi:hypothetical protein